MISQKLKSWGIVTTTPQNSGGKTACIWYSVVAESLAQSFSYLLEPNAGRLLPEVNAELLLLSFRASTAWIEVAHRRTYIK